LSASWLILPTSPLPLKNEQEAQNMKPCLQQKNKKKTIPKVNSKTLERAAREELRNQEPWLLTVSTCTHVHR
jgi:hypothetical protein